MNIHSSAQSIEEINKNLSESYNKISYWSRSDPYDSLNYANKNFEQLLLKYTAENIATISYSFKKLADSGLRIHTSEDGLFRIYTWDDETGGTMRSAFNVFQWMDNGKVYSKNLRIADSLEEYYCYPFYLQINDVSVGNRNYYITQNVAIGSSAIAAFTVKVFSIDEGKLNDNAQLIKTKSGIRNELSYYVDWSATTNRDSDVPRETAQIQYDSKNKIISIPLIEDDDKITTKRIRYKFNGQYFVKM